MNHNKQRPPRSIVLFCLIMSVALLTLPFYAFAEDEDALPVQKTIFAANGGAKGALANSLPALVLAAGTEADYIAFGVIATRDHQLIVHHNIDLGPDTDVADKFPEHAREDGRFLSIDFTLDEIRLLRKTEKNDFAAPTNVSPGIATLSEYLALAKYLEEQFSKKIGLAPNLIYPGYQRNKGIDISILCLTLLDKFGYNTSDSRLLLQSMDADELQRISKELLPRFDFKIPLIQRIGSQPADTEAAKSPLGDYDQTWMFTRLGARMISSYSSGIALDTSLLHDPFGDPQNREFLENIRALAIPVYAIIPDIPAPLPPFAEDGAAFCDFYLNTLDMEGIITNAYKEFSLHLKQEKEAGGELRLPLFPLKPVP